MDQLKVSNETPSKKANSEWINLNVGGRVFTTTLSTLVNKEPDSMLARMFSMGPEGFHLNPSNTDSSGAYLIDRSPIYFEPIINYLRHGQLVYDHNINPLGILEEAKFYGIDSLIPQLEAIIGKCFVIILNMYN